MATCINVTFKNNNQEMALYVEALSHYSRGNWIKESMNFFMKYGHMERQLKEMLAQENAKRA